MRFGPLSILVATLLMLAEPAFADPPEVLYDEAPWAVARVTDFDMATCQARIISSEGRVFKVIGTPDRAFITVGAIGWHFVKHSGWLTLKVAPSAAKLDGALYEGNYVGISSTVEVIYDIMLIINRPGDLEVLDDKEALLATFPFTGMTKAMKVWKACIDDLSQG
jgi:hypothetical protein